MISARHRKLWKRLVQNYGTRMTEQYGTQPPEDWCDVIDRVSDEQLDRAMVAIRRQHLKFPPTLGEFEAAIPERRIGPDASVPDLLAQGAVRAFRLCLHQLAMPWTYFGDATTNETHGVVIPACRNECCEKFGKAGHRLKVEEVEHYLGSLR